MNDGIKMFLLLIVLTGVFFTGGYFVGAGYGHRDDGIIIDDLRREIALGRAGYDRLSKENAELIELHKSSGETTKIILGLIESGERELAKGITTIREAIEIVRGLRTRNSEIKAVLHNKELDYRGIGSVSYSGVRSGLFYWDVHGIIANPPCTEFSRARSGGMARDTVSTEIRIIKETNPVWWIIENPSSGSMRDILGRPDLIYQPWEYGSPWTKKTALWGRFNIPRKLYTDWEDVPKNPDLYTRPTREKPSLAFLHKSSINFIPEFAPFKDHVKTDADLRSLCSQGFARAFKEANP